MKPQSGIFAFGTSEHCYVELDLVDGASPAGLARRLAGLHGLGSPVVAAGVVVGLRPELWASVAGEAAIAGVRSFERIETAGCVMPATQHDAVFWCAGSSRDDVFDGALAAIAHFDGVARPAFEVTAWTHEKIRDLTGFIDGTENPPPFEAPSVALVAGGPAAGSSVLLLQQWEHLPSFVALSIVEQEAVIGRTKADSIELPAGEMPPDSHVSRTVVEEDGAELAIFRRNTAWGGPTRHGTMFVGFSASQHPLQVMLERMAGLPDGVRDALTRHTVALTGAYYVVPSLDALAVLLPDGQ